MKKWIRWQGLMAFVVITAVITLIWLLMADGIVKRAIEAGGTAAVGAKVELHSANLSLMPLGLTLEGLKVTDPDAPMTNAFEADRIAFLIDSGRMLMDKVYVNEMQVEDIRLGTQRKTSGAIKEPAKANGESPTDTSDPMVSMSLETPDIDELIEKEGLETIQLAEQVNEELDTKEALWDKRLKKIIPSEATFNGFKKRYKRIRKLSKGRFEDKLIALKDAKKLKKDIKQTYNALETATKDLRTDVRKLKKDVKAALAAPKKDLKRLKSKYGLSGQGLQNMSAMLFGPKVEQYISKARSLYSMASQYTALDNKGNNEPKAVPRHKGVDIKFIEHNPAADFSVKLTKVSLLLEGGKAIGKIENISSNQKVTGIPTTFAIETSGLNNMKSLSATGSIDLTELKSPAAISRIVMDIKGYNVTDMKVSDSALPIVIKSGKADLKANAVIIGDTPASLDANINMLLHSARISSEIANDKGKLMTALAGTISSLESFTLSAKATGTLSDYDIKLASDMDGKLKAAAGKMAKDEARKFETSLKAKIKAKTKDSLSEISAKLKTMTDKNDKVNNYMNRLESML